jgi:hypothetical protein
MSGKLIINGAQSTVCVFHNGMPRGLIPSLESPLVSFSVLGGTMIVVDTLEVAVELFERRSAVYSSRYICEHGIITIMLTVLGLVFQCWI